MDESIISKVEDDDCGVSEEMFPCMGTCCYKNNGIFKGPYEKLCASCEISTSLPSGENMKAVTIFECVRFGYGKMVTE
ncbi:MAG: hypothetical protein GX154_06465 [Clostridiales bacterium]|nr:hypothetical protein [Clostridiales bacterium]